MPLHDDGDVVRACGFIAIYFGNLEKAVDDLLRGAAALFFPMADIESSILKLGFGAKIGLLERGFNDAFNGSKYGQIDDDRISVERACRALRAAATERNEAIHSSIIALPTGETVRNSRRQGLKAVRSSELYDLANSISNLEGSVYALTFVAARLTGARG